MSSYYTRLWSEKEFGESESLWTELLQRSETDNLFLSWRWQYNWWSIYRKQDSELFLIAVYSDRKLVGLAPLYLEADAYLKGFIPILRIQPIGKRLHGSSGIRTEYLQFIIDSEHMQGALQLIIEALDSDRRWHELFLGDWLVKSHQTREFEKVLELKRWYRREESRGVSFGVTLQPFEDYLSKLGRNTRLKLYNRRKLLETLGCVKAREVDNSSLPILIELINSLHLRRWNKLAFKPCASAFLQGLVDGQSTLSLKGSSILSVDGQALSGILNLTYQNKEYNIQLGFEESFHPKLSLGTLHLGYAIEKAMERGVDLLDLLEGGGRSENYKQKIANEVAEMTSMRLVRSKRLKVLFGLYDRYLRK